MNIEMRPERHIHIDIHKNEKTDAVAFLFHGLGGRADQWREQINLLKNDYTLIIPDLLGHGESAKPKPALKNPYDFLEFEKDVTAIFERFSGKKNLVVGHSYGCALAVSLTLKHLSEVNQLILLTPIPCEPSFDIPFMYHFPLWLMTLLRPLLEKKFQALAFDPSDSPDLIRYELKETQKNPLYVIKAMVVGMKNIPKMAIEQLTLPVMVMSGEHDKLILPAIQKKSYQALPNKKFLTIKNAAHLPHLERPQEVNDALLTFLKS